VNNHSAVPRVHVIVLVLAVFLFSSCNRSHLPPAKRYPFTGRVVSVDAEDKSALIDADAIPGFMEAMAMPYKIKPPETISQLTPGDSISAEVVVQRDDDSEVPPSYWLENVKITAHGKSPAPITQHIPAPGDEVPDFTLTNQDGKHISLKQYRGKVLLVTFIYTRCPFPDFCPRVSNNFAEVDKQLGTNPSLANVQLLSISFDPEHDTPKVLRDYALSVAHTRDPKLFRRWEFAAPRIADLPRIADFFGLVYKPEAGLITHNLSTAVIGADGKIVNWYHGGDWQVSDLIKDAEKSTSESASSAESGKGTTSVVP
jgi:protein SCO1/2